METTERIPQTPPSIAPLRSDVQRVLWSVMIPAYNCSKYLTETIESVLQQDPGEDVMQIEVIDDCSTDDNVEELVGRVGKGRVAYYCQKENVGSLRNFETCINRARGQYIHLLHGDDRVMPGYYRGIEGEFDSHPDAGAVFCSWVSIDENGKVLGQVNAGNDKGAILEQSLLKLAKLNLIQYVAITVKREVYEKVGSFYAARYGEDWLMWVTISKLYPIAYLPKTLAQYRLHSQSISSSSLLTGEHLKDIKRVFSLTEALLPPERKKEIMKHAYRDYAYYALQVTNGLWHSLRNPTPVIKQIRGLLSFYVDAKIIEGISYLLTWMLKEKIKNALHIKPRKETDACSN